jgi:hypothetical protein
MGRKFFTRAMKPVGFWTQAVAGGSPTLSSATVSADGTTVTLAFSGNVTHTTGTEPAIAMTVGTSGTSPGAATLVYASGSGTTSLVYTFTRTGKVHNLTAVETSAVSYTSGALNCAAFGSTGTTNNSTQQTYTASDTYANTGDDIDWDSSGAMYQAMQFTVGATSYKLTQVGLWLLKVGSPTYGLTAQLYADTGCDAPSASLTQQSSNSVVVSGLTGSFAETKFQGFSTSLTNGSKWWLAGFSDAAGNGSNFAAWEAASSDGLQYYSASPLSWSAGSTNRALHAVTYSSP